ncbi:hypothetical protein EV179_006270 [Coemansia sp. RSA 487]|nr:hypothetical protein EV179_006270 [Coemansia sp. RSA 487]
MLNTITILCALAASAAVLATDEIPQLDVPAIKVNLQPQAPAIGNQQPVEVGYAPQVLVASQQYAADKSKESLQQGGLARAGANAVDTSSEELLLSDIFGSIDSMDRESSKADEFSSGAGRQFSLFDQNIAAAAAIAASVGVAFTYL